MELPHHGWKNRAAAGVELGKAMRNAIGSHTNPLVLGLPRGGVAVASPVASATNGELDILVVMKVGVPWHPELALGAVTAFGDRVYNDDIIAHLQLDTSALESAFTQTEARARQRNEILRMNRPELGVSGRTVVVVDDGIATGATIMAAIRLLTTLKPAWLCVATPVAPVDTTRKISSLVDHMITLRTPEDFTAVGVWFDTFDQVTDDEVRQILETAKSTP